MSQLLFLSQHLPPARSALPMPVSAPDPPGLWRPCVGMTVKLSLFNALKVVCERLRLLSHRSWGLSFVELAGCIVFFLRCALPKAARAYSSSQEITSFYTLYHRRVRHSFCFPVRSHLQIIEPTTGSWTPPNPAVSQLSLKKQGTKS